MSADVNRSPRHRADSMEGKAPASSPGSRSWDVEMEAEQPSSETEEAALGEQLPIGSPANRQTPSPAPGQGEETAAGLDRPSPPIEGLDPGSQGDEPHQPAEEARERAPSGSAAEDSGQSPGAEPERQDPEALAPPLAPPHRDEDVMAEGWRAHRKHVFVLSEAGKPIYSRYGNEEALSSTMGVMMALVSFVQAGNNVIRSIQSDDYKVVFSQQGPLVLVSVSRTRQSEEQLCRELLYVYYQIISMLTQVTVTRIFERKKNYDLRRLLAGSEKILDTLLDHMDSDPSFLLGAVQCLPLPSSLRDSVSQILQKAVTPNLVFSILLARSQLVAIVQEKAVIEDSRLDPVDLHLLFNLITGSSSFQAGEVWTPICLPRLYPDSYFYAYISYLDPACTVCLLLISTDKTAFYSVSDCKKRIEEGLRGQGLLQAIAGALQSNAASASHVGVSDLWHFMYKPLDIPDNHKQLTQYTSPEIEAPYSTDQEKEHLFDLYQYLHSRIHSLARPLKLIYHVAEKETLLAWVTGKFELYTCFSPLVTKAAAINIITKLLRWIKKEEDQLFIRSPLKYSTTPNPSRGSKGARPGTDRLDSADNGFLSLL